MYAGYVILGTVFLLLAGLMALLVTFIMREDGSTILLEPMFYMLSGVFLEAFCFALGLGKQARQTELDKLEVQQQLVLKVQREAQLEKDILASQVQTLRAQMNPHFIFNALNSIQHFVLSNQKENSVRYLSRVSQLIRRILQNSTSPNITLDEEIETLKSYIEIEQLRFQPAFSFECVIDEALDTEMIRIPHLMIQPFIENAILHGLVHRKEQGVLKLDISECDEQSIEVVITDNGIGREEAGKIARQHHKKHNSISVKSIESRIRLMLPEAVDPVRIEDLQDEHGNGSGTRVRLIIPVV
jgi:LytS/YehU family sensor histidine kinase